MEALIKYYKLVQNADRKCGSAGMIAGALADPLAGLQVVLGDIYQVYHST